VRIVLVCPYAWDAAGGVQVHIGDLHRHLLARGHEVRVLSPFRARSAAAGVVPAGRAIPIPYRGTVAPIAPWPAVGRLRWALRRWRPDVVHVHEPFTPSTSMWTTLASPAPVVATFHAFLDRSRTLELARPLLGPVRRRLDVVIAVSDAAARFLATAVPGLDPVVIPNGVEVGAFAAATPEDLPPGPTIVWVNRLDPQKGFTVALDAFERLLIDHPDAWFVVAGDGPDRAAVEGLPPAVRARIRMLGAVAHARVPGLMRAADVVISPAVGQESFGIVLVEAMASGVPVVATDIPGYRQVIRDGVEGLLVAPGDPSALAAAIGHLLADRVTADTLAKAGREHARFFDWPVVVGAIEACYREATGPPRPSLR
jgi:phosphatidyl-myo-inositol alpha-mannosyltransferase